MIARLIDYLINQPSATSSPLYVALNTNAVKSAMGLTGNDVVSLVDTQGEGATEIKAPMVLVRATNEVQNLVEWQGGATRGYTQEYALLLGCSAYGATRNQAEQRANQLKLGVEGVLRSVRASGIDAANLVTSDPNNPGVVFDKVENWRIDRAFQDVTTGKDSAGQWVATDNLRLWVMVKHQG